jgi:DNA helicase HerA-like ATPase
MTDTPASKALTESLLTVIRQQRHYGVRVLISTQEPTVSPRLVDLCSITVIHRFSSPEWFSVLRRHISIVNEQGTTDSADELFGAILNLRTGEAMVFAPSAIVQKREGAQGLGKLNGELLKMRMRKRLSWDSGRSIVCV